MANAAKVLTIRHLCGGIDSRLLVLCSRVFAAVVLIPLLVCSDYALPTSGLFWGVILITAVLTAVASILLTDAIKMGQLASVMPMQATVPLFMLFVLIIGFKEHPGTGAIFWIAATTACLGITLYLSCSAKGLSRGAKFWVFALFSLAAAMIFGLTTVLDRVAITAVTGGALAYSGCWNLASSAILGVECVRKRVHWRLSRRKLATVAIFSVLALAAFYCQQFAVQLSASLPGAVVNVKTIIMLHLPVVVGANYLSTEDKCSKRQLFLGLLTIACGIALIQSL